MAKYTEAQKQAIYSYMEDKTVIRITVAKQKADEYKERAKAQGKSLTKYITDILDGNE